MKVAVVGCRPPKRALIGQHIDLYRAICNDAYDFVRRLPKGTTIVSGGAQGVDHAAKIAVERTEGLKLVEHLPEYERFGPTKAPLARNLLIVRDADEIHAWPAPWSHGTWHTINAAKRAGKPVHVHEVQR